MRCGIEFEYLLIDARGPTRGRVRDFGNLPYPDIAALLDIRPGEDDPALATGDLGIKRGYWYLEGDERFHDDGRFATLAVKGVEIRTPPADGAAAALAQLAVLERQLAAELAGHGLALAVAGFHPMRGQYTFTPPLNAWEHALRARCRAYDGSQVSTLSYGPDINLSHPGWSAERALAAARRLHAAAPYIVPFSFSSPFLAGLPWGGLSWRTLQRAPLRPAVKLYLNEGAGEALACGLCHPPRLASEHGRIEFKAFDALLSPALLGACCTLLIGLCLADGPRLSGETPDTDAYQRAAQYGFADPDIRQGAQRWLALAEAALRRHGQSVAALAPLHALLASGRTPAHSLLDAYARDGQLYQAGGLFTPAGR